MIKIRVCRIGNVDIIAPTILEIAALVIVLLFGAIVLALLR